MQQVKDMQKFGIGYDVVVFLDVDKEEVIRRLTKRGRKDDTPEIISDRIALYKKETFQKQKRFRFYQSSKEQLITLEIRKVLFLSSEVVKDKIKKNMRDEILRKIL